MSVRRDDNVAEIDTHPPLDAAALRHFSVAGEHPPLHFDGAPHRVHDTAKLDESPVTRILDDPAAMLADLGFDDLAPARDQATVSALLVAAHQSRIADDVHHKDRRQPTLQACCPIAGIAARAPCPVDPSLDKYRCAAGQRPCRSGFRQFRQQILQHGPAPFIRRDPPDRLGWKNKSPVRIRRGLKPSICEDRSAQTNLSRPPARG